MPPTLTCAPGANSTPLGLTKKTWPLALSAPCIREGSLPTTRLSATELADGWTKLTVFPWPILNDCQLVMSLSEFCWMLSVVADWLNWASPAATCAPSGRSAADAKPGTASSAVHSSPAPRDLTHSATAT